MTIGIVVALPEELSTLTPVKLARGETLALNASVLVCLSGAGQDNAAQASEKLIQQGANRLISWGCAAATSPNLQPGDLVVTSTLITPDHTLTHASNWAQTLAKQLKNLNTITELALASQYGLISNSHAKQAIYEQTGAVGLDMESAAIAETAIRQQLPFVSLRAIADPAAMTLPSAVIKALNAEGEIVKGVLLTHLLSHFWEVPALIQLGLHFRAAQNTLKSVAKQLELCSDG